MEKEYAQHALNPSRWPIFVGKMDQALKDFKGWPESEVHSIKAPSLLIFGDNDAVQLEYEVHLFRMLGGDKAMGGFTPLVNQMAVLSNTTTFPYSSGPIFSFPSSIPSLTRLCQRKGTFLMKQEKGCFRKNP
jgi:hypothetical protein